MKAIPRRYYQRIKEGVPVIIDKIQRNSKFGSGYGVRVIGVWKNPTWLDLDFFESINDTPTSASTYCPKCGAYHDNEGEYYKYCMVCGTKCR